MRDWVSEHKELVGQAFLFLGIFLGVAWIHEPSRYYFFGDSWDMLYGFLQDPRSVFGFNNEHFIPLLKAFFLLQYKIFGPHHLGYELILLAMHSAAALLVYRIGRRLNLSPSFSLAASLIFAFSSVPWEITGWSFEQQFASGIVLGLASTDAFLESLSGKRVLIRSALLSLIGFWFAGPIVLAFTLTLTAYWILLFPSTDLAQKEKRFKVFAALWGPAVIYFLSYRVAMAVNARIPINSAPVSVPHLSFRNLPLMVDFALYGAVNGVILRALTFVRPERLLSATAILIILTILLMVCYRRFASNQRTAFWFLTFLFFASYFVIAIGRLQDGVFTANAPRYQYLPMASLALILVLCWDGLRREYLGEVTPAWWHGLSILFLGYYLVFHSITIRKDNMAAERGVVAQNFLKAASEATYPVAIPKGAVVLGPEIPVPFDVTPAHRPLWQIFDVLKGNIRSVVPVDSYLANEKALAPFNFVRDGGFEEPIGADWRSYGGAQFTQTPQAAHTGQFGASLVLPFNSAFSQDVISNCLLPLANKIFTFAIEAKTGLPQALKARIIFKSKDNSVLEFESSDPPPGDNQWHQLVISGLSPPGTCTVGVDVINEGNGELTASVDDALLVLHPGTVDAEGNSTFQRPDTIAVRREASHLSRMVRTGR